MSAHKPDTEREIINLADHLIRTKGFNAFSYADIALPLEIRKPAVHYYFPAKSDLGIAVIHKELQRMLLQQEKQVALPGDEQLRQMVNTFFRGSRNGLICLTGSLTPEYDTFTPAMQKSVREMCDAILDWTTSCLDKGRAAGRLRFSGEPRDRALLVMSGLLSSLLLSRVLGREVFDRMINRILEDLEADFRTDGMDGSL